MSYSLKSLIRVSVESGDIMANIIEDFYYGNLEPQEVNLELTSKLKKKLSNIEKKEEQLTAKLSGEDLVSA